MTVKWGYFIFLTFWTKAFVNSPISLPALLFTVKLLTILFLSCYTTETSDYYCTLQCENEWNGLFLAIQPFMAFWVQPNVLYYHGNVLSWSSFPPFLPGSLGTRWAARCRARAPCFITLMGLPGVWQIYRNNRTRSLPGRRSRGRQMKLCGALIQDSSFDKYHTKTLYPRVLWYMMCPAQE